MKHRNILQEISKRKANWIGHILRRNCLLQQVIEGKIKEGIEVTGRQGRRCRKILDDLKERRGYSYLKEVALDRTMWRARFGRGFGPVVRQTAKWMDEYETSASPIKEVPRLFLTKYYLNLKISKHQSSHYRNVCTDPQGIEHRSLGICGAHFGNSRHKLFQSQGFKVPYQDTGTELS
jgi:hypothetical protein